MKTTLGVAAVLLTSVALAQGVAPSGGGLETDSEIAGSLSVGPGGISTDGGVYLRELAFSDGTTQTTAPTATLAGRTLLRQSATGLAHYAQPFFVDRRVSWVVPSGASSSLAFGTEVAVSGAQSNVTGSSTTAMRWNRLRKARVSSGGVLTDDVVSYAYASATAGHAISGSNGYYVSIKAGYGTTTADAEWMAGVSAAALSTSTPSALANTVYMGCVATDDTLRVGHNDASGTATEIDLGDSFPCTSSNLGFWLQLYVAPGGTSAIYRVEYLNAVAGSTVATGTISTNLPATTTNLIVGVWGNTGASASAINLDVGHLYAESDG